MAIENKSLNEIIVIHLVIDKTSHRHPNTLELSKN